MSTNFLRHIYLQAVYFDFFFHVSEHKNIFSRRFLLSDFFPLVPLSSTADVEVALGRVC